MNYEASLIQTVQTLKTSSRVAESWRLYRSQAHRRRTVSPCQVKMSFPGKQRVAGLASAPVSHPCVGTGGPHESGWLLGAARTMCIHIYIYISLKQMQKVLPKWPPFGSYMILPLLTKQYPDWQKGAVYKPRAAGTASGIGSLFESLSNSWDWRGPARRRSCQDPFHRPIRKTGTKTPIIPRWEK